MGLMMKEEVQWRARARVPVEGRAGVSGTSQGQGCATDLPGAQLEMF